MSQPPGVDAAGLPRDALALVLAPLAGDVRSLCASACVARAWRDAAAQPRLWTHIVCRRRKLTGEHLAWLVARAQGGLERLELGDAYDITDKDLYAALQQPHVLTHFSVRDCGIFPGLTGQGVAGALASRRGQLQYLQVGDVLCVPEDWRITSAAEYAEAVAAGTAPLPVWQAESREEVMEEMEALLAPDGVLDCVHCLGGYGFHGTCDELCCGDNVCQTCRIACCGECGDGFYMGECRGCFKTVCQNCIAEAKSMLIPFLEEGDDDVDDIESCLICVVAWSLRGR
jgi:hypothetical protein